MAAFVYYLVSSFLLPPLNLIVLGGAGLVFYRSNLRAIRMLVLFTLALLYIFSTPYLVNIALSRFESLPRQANQVHPEAIVVLGGGSEYKNERLRHAARLYKQTGLPILVTGGGPLAEPGTETEVMKAVLENDFNVPVKWVEASSTSTYENAINTSVMLKGENVHTIFLVTNAWHMPRASYAFKKEGVAVVESPIQSVSYSKPGMFLYLPDAESLLKSSILMHEWIGLAWYKLAKY